MNCDQFRESMADFLGGTLSEEARAGFYTHRAECAACRKESEMLERTWRSLGLLEVPEPGPALRARFYQSLEGYRRALDAEAAGPARHGFRESFRLWWGRQPVFQVAFSLALLILGLAIGRMTGEAGRGSRAEVAELQAELRTMHQMVSLALLQQQSASDRLRGVDYSCRVDQPDTEVLSALMYTLDHDSNVNVRLAAVDALRKFASQPMVRRGLDESLTKQDSPLVQIALIDLIADVRDTQGLASLRALARSPAANETVRARATLAVERMGR